MSRLCITFPGYSFPVFIKMIRHFHINVPDKEILEVEPVTDMLGLTVLSIHLRAEIMGLCCSTPQTQSLQGMNELSVYKVYLVKKNDAMKQQHLKANLEARSSQKNNNQKRL